MKRYLMAILITMILALGVVVGCRQEATPVPTTSDTSVPTRTQDEVCALIYSYLESRVTTMSHVPYRMNLLKVLDIARPYFRAVYRGSGKWEVWALGCTIDSSYRVTGYSYDGSWNFYEASGVIEPLNNKATELQRYIQRWTE